jgi:geranylgeranyl diphosphate synthase type II
VIALLVVRAGKCLKGIQLWSIRATGTPLSMSSAGKSAAFSPSLAPRPVAANGGGEALSLLRQRVDERLGALIPGGEVAPQNLHLAMRHALLAPSKRVRPVMCYLIAGPDGSGEQDALDVGCAIEMVHTASLILDDLPCMDDAALRRQRPTTHIAFGESTAILAAIALMNRAFGVIAELEAVPAPVRTRLAAILSEAIGSNGLVAGQEIDINGRSDFADARPVEHLNWLKTGVLFVASAEMGAVLGGLDSQQIAAVGSFARHFGLAFQTADDLLDQTAKVAEAGKDVGQDGHKPTLVSILGVEQAKMSCAEHLAQARRALAEARIDATRLDELVARVFQARSTTST